MNTKIKTTALVCAALFAVTACSSNGESGPDINPTNPITPTKPTTPTTPAQPTTPETPAKPTTPVTPAKPATPETPAKPANPVTPAKPTTPETPAKPTTPVTPAKPTTPVTPAKPTTPVTPAKPTTPVTPAKPTTPVTPAKPTTPVTPAKPATPNVSVGGNALSVKAGELSIAQYTVPVGNMNTSIDVDGHKIDLSKPSLAPTFFYSLGNDDLNVRQIYISGKKYSYVRFGREYWVSPTIPEGNRDTVFAIGNLTPTSGVDAMPTSGKATYIGDSIFGHNLVDAKFNVDFGRKSITGVLNSEAEYLYPRVSLKGTISGASFSGDENGTSMRGNFFGPKAAELGGVFRVDYNDGSGTYGSFGAKKQ